MLSSPPPIPRDDLRFSKTNGILQKKTMWFIGVGVEQETSAPPPKKKNPGSAPDSYVTNFLIHALPPPPSSTSDFFRLNDNRILVNVVSILFYFCRDA